MNSSRVESRRAHVELRTRVGPRSGGNTACEGRHAPVSSQTGVGNTLGIPAAAQLEGTAATKNTARPTAVGAAPG